jgi:hypothetical protein
MRRDQVFMPLTRHSRIRLARLNSGLEIHNLGIANLPRASKTLDPCSTCKVPTGGSTLPKVRATMPCSTYGEE